VPHGRAHLSNDFPAFLSGSLGCDETCYATHRCIEFATVESFAPSLPSEAPKAAMNMLVTSGRRIGKIP
jgi:hypothetical protein